MIFTLIRDEPTAFYWPSEKSLFFSYGKVFFYLTRTLMGDPQPPNYNPIEKLWKKIKEKEIHLHYFPTFECLKNKVEEALLHFKDLKNEILPLFGFYRNLAEV
ncbi:hypothetical protein [Desulfosarcina ovata]|uniref:hypothetical protein n=1 Tax=Desulfosarcina ovata TaxID=83564 RepID=UPI0018D7355F|nr:hypothetical protein [Desulfosarcina ovata]